MITEIAAKFGGDVLGGISSYFGNKAKLDAYRRGANKQITAENEAYGLGKDYYDDMIREYGDEAKTYDADLGIWRDAQSQAPIQMGDFDESQYQISKYLDPSMRYQQEEAKRAIEQSAAARGGMFAGSGATAKALQDRASDIALKGFDSAADRMSSDRTFGYGKFKDKFEAAKLAESERINRLGEMLKASGTARQNQFDAKGGFTDLGMSSKRAIGDIYAGKDRAQGDFYGSVGETVGNGFKSLGDGISTALTGNTGGVGNLSKTLNLDLNSLSQNDKLQLLSKLIGGK